MEIRVLRYFLAAVREGSITGAGKSSASDTAHLVPPDPGAGRRAGTAASDTEKP